MFIDDLLKEKKMSRYELSKVSGVPQTTIADICSGKANLNNCKAGTLYRIAKVLDVSVDYILDDYNKKIEDIRVDFDQYRSNVCHELKEKGNFYFCLEILETNRIRKLYEKKWYPEVFYLLAMIDYLSRLEGLALVEEYNDIRKQKLKEPIFPGSVIVTANILVHDDIKGEAIKNAIPEFMNFNIVEGDIFDVA